MPDPADPTPAAPSGPPLWLLFLLILVGSFALTCGLASCMATRRVPIPVPEQTGLQIATPWLRPDTDPLLVAR